MAIDTNEKRASALGTRWARLPFGRRFMGLIPDGLGNQGDRQQMAGDYRGILAGAPSALSPTPYYAVALGTAGPGPVATGYTGPGPVATGTKV